MKSFKRIAAAIFAVCMLFSGCGQNKGGSEADQTESFSAAKPDFSGTFASMETEQTESDEDEDDEAPISVYTGREVENEEDLAIFKFNCTLPEGFETIIDSADGKQYASPLGGIVVKAQNYKEEFQELEVMADSGCAGIKISNMLNQSDTEFSDPIKTKVAGFDAIRYDYTVTAYIYPPVTDADGNYMMTDEGKYVLSEEKELYGEFVNRVYYFYSDEDVFYVICESNKDSADKAAPLFDQFIDSITISKK